MPPPNRPSMGCSFFRKYLYVPAWFPLWAAEDSLFHYLGYLLLLLLISLQCLEGCFPYIHCFLLSLRQTFALLLNTFFPELSPSWVRGSAMPYTGSISLGWNKLGSAQRSPSVFLQKSLNLAHSPFHNHLATYIK